MALDRIDKLQDCAYQGSHCIYSLRRDIVLRPDISEDDDCTSTSEWLNGVYVPLAGSRQELTDDWTRSVSCPANIDICRSTQQDVSHRGKLGGAEVKWRLFGCSTGKCANSIISSSYKAIAETRSPSPEPQQPAPGACAGVESPHNDHSPETIITGIRGNSSPSLIIANSLDIAPAKRKDSKTHPSTGRDQSGPPQS